MAVAAVVEAWIEPLPGTCSFLMPFDEALLCIELVTYSLPRPQYECPAMAVLFRGVLYCCTLTATLSVQWFIRSIERICGKNSTASIYEKFSDLRHTVRKNVCGLIMRTVLLRVDHGNRLIDRNEKAVTGSSILADHYLSCQASWGSDFWKRYTSYRCSKTQ